MSVSTMSQQGWEGFQEIHHRPTKHVESKRCVKLTALGEYFDHREIWLWTPEKTGCWAMRINSPKIFWTSCLLHVWPYKQTEKLDTLEIFQMLKFYLFFCQKKVDQKNVWSSGHILYAELGKVLVVRSELLLLYVWLVTALSTPTVH